MKPIHKLNGGLGATLCYNCTKIISTGLTKELYCSDDCKEKYSIREYYKQMDKEVHQNRANLNK